jgi:hypothetical protein
MKNSMPANPGVDPSLTHTTLAEYAMSKVLVKNKKSGREISRPLLVIIGYNPLQGRSE